MRSMSLKYAMPVIGLVLVMPSVPGALAETPRSDDAAHAIAEKFSGAAEAKRRAEAEKKAAKEKLEQSRRREAEEARRAAERARAEEEEMLARARREAAEREEANRKALEDEARAARVRAEAEEAARREAARLEAERALRMAKEAEEARRLEAEKRAEEERQARGQELARVEAARRQEAERQREEEQRKHLEAEREAEARRLAEKHSRLREEREAQRREGRAEDALPATGFDQPSAVGARDLEPRPSHQTAGPSVRDDSRVTVLLAMRPGTRGIRRYQRTADPVLCAGPSCWLSAGPGEPAMRVSRHKALGPANTLGARAWACRRSLDCAFRGVEVGALSAASLQPIDLGFLKHHRREAVAVSADVTCEIEAGRLTCGNPVETRSWRAWIVPESIAIEAGPELLRGALAGGLPELHEASWRR